MMARKSSRSGCASAAVTPTEVWRARAGALGLFFPPDGNVGRRVRFADAAAHCASRRGEFVIVACQRVCGRSDDAPGNGRAVMVAGYRLARTDEPDSFGVPAAPGDLVFLD